MKKRFLLALAIAMVCLSQSLYAQEIKITVSDRDEPASYAFIKVNDKYVGMADSLGIFILSKKLIQKGDTLSAEYIALLSDKVLYTSRSDEYNLQIQEFVLDDVHIKAEKLHTFEEYEKILNRKENNYNWSLNHYELEYEQSIKNNLTDSLWSSSGTMELSVHYSEKPPYQILKHIFSGDTSKMEMYVGIAILFTKRTLHGMLTNWAKTWRKMGKLMIHKISGVESDKNCYGFIGGVQTDDRMIVYVDNITGIITEVRFLSLKEGFLQSCKILVEYKPEIKSPYPKEVFVELNNGNGLHINTHLKINYIGRISKEKSKRMMED